MSLVLSYRGSVNSWECDENDHLNVRFYVEKHWQTLVSGLPELALTPSKSGEDLIPQVAVQHIRFLQESRLAAPLSGYVGVVAVGAGHVDVLTELRQSFTDEPLSACVHRLSGIQCAAPRHTLPSHAAPRGVADEDIPHTSLPMSAVEDFAFHTIGMGVIGADECTPQGLLGIHHYMGRISDSMPHLWGLLRAERGELNAGEGGAVLEYRLRYHQPLRLGQRFCVRSGVSSVSAKVQLFSHLIFNQDSGELCTSAQAAGVRMDLVERRAKVLSEEMQAHMRQRMIKPMASSA